MSWHYFVFPWSSFSSSLLRLSSTALRFLVCFQCSYAPCKYHYAASGKVVLGIMFNFSAELCSPQFSKLSLVSVPGGAQVGGVSLLVLSIQHTSPSVCCLCVSSY